MAETTFTCFVHNPFFMIFILENMFQPRPLFLVEILYKALVSAGVIRYVNIHLV